MFGCLVRALFVSWTPSTRTSMSVNIVNIRYWHQLNKFILYFRQPEWDGKFLCGSPRISPTWRVEGLDLKRGVGLGLFRERLGAAVLNGSIDHGADACSRQESLFSCSEISPAWKFQAVRFLFCFFPKPLFSCSIHAPKYLKVGIPSGFVLFFCFRTVGCISSQQVDQPRTVLMCYHTSELVAAADRNWVTVLLLKKRFTRWTHHRFPHEWSRYFRAHIYIFLICMICMIFMICKI